MKCPATRLIWWTFAWGLLGVVCFSSSAEWGLDVPGWWILFPGMILLGSIVGTLVLVQRNFRAPTVASTGWGTAAAVGWGAAALIALPPLGPGALLVCCFFGCLSADAAFRGRTELALPHEGRTRRWLAGTTIAVFTLGALVLAAALAPTRTVRPWREPTTPMMTSMDSINFMKVEGPDVFDALGVTVTSELQRRATVTDLDWLETRYGGLAWYQIDDGAYTLLAFERPNGPDGPYALVGDTRLDAARVLGVVMTAEGPIVAARSAWSLDAGVEDFVASFDRDLSPRARLPIDPLDDGFLRGLSPAGPGRARVHVDDGDVFLVDASLSRWPGGALSPAWERLGFRGLFILLALGILLVPLLRRSLRAGRTLIAIGRPLHIGTLGETTLHLHTGEVIGLDPSQATHVGAVAVGEPCVAIGPIREASPDGAYRGPRRRVDPFLLVGGDEADARRTLLRRHALARADLLTATWFATFVLATFMLV